MLKKGELAKNIRDFLDGVKEKEQYERDDAIERYCKNMEDVIYEAIKNLEIHIPPGTITVVGSASAQKNVVEIVLKGIMLK